MSRIPGSSPISDDIEDIRHSGDDDNSLVGDDFPAVSDESESEDIEAEEDAEIKRTS